MKVLLFILLLYLGLTALLCFFADRIIYIPPYPSYKDSDEIIKLPIGNGLEVSAIYLPNPNAKYVLLYSHGNAEDLGYVKDRLELYKEAGFSVFAYDYPGYGTSNGKPTEESIYKAIFASYNYLTQKLGYKPRQIVPYGFSIGCTPSLELAIKQPIKGLIIQGCFTSISRIFTGFPLFFCKKYENLAKIRKFYGKTLVLHGKQDEIVPFNNGKAMFEAAHEPKFFYWADQADHNNFIELAGKEYWEKLAEFRTYLDLDKHTGNKASTG